MALTDLQRRACRILAADRISSGEVEVGGRMALNGLTGGARASRDVDLFHDTDEALAMSWPADRALLQADGLRIRVLRERPGLVEVIVDDGADQARLEWARDSAYRFFPLQEHDELGLTLHPFDLATNKVLAMVGRSEVRAWVDVITSDERIQPLGYLAWAASGKDPGFGPAAILEAAARTGRYSAEEVAQLAFHGDPPGAAELSRRWHQMMDTARATIALLPPGEAGACVLDTSGGLLRTDTAALARELAGGRVRFHRGSIRGAWPRLIEEAGTPGAP